MRSHRRIIPILIIFSIAYPLVSGGVLLSRWDGGIGEIYPIAPWTLFCFVPNREIEYAVRLREANGRALGEAEYFENCGSFAESQKTVGVAIVQEMGRWASDPNSTEFREQRSLFEKSFLLPVARHVRYELVRREFDVLERWRTGRCEKVDVVAKFVFDASEEGT
jgi:hypothetical protein